ncbi:MAG: hypothetical protein ACREOJ_09160 [Gemmatimonadaceae bacterium]
MAIAGASAACAPGHASVGDSTAAAGSAMLKVSNHYGQPVDVFVTSQGASYRLGTVSPGIDSRFVVRSTMIRNGPVEFVAVPGAGEVPVRSGQLVLAPGNVVDFLIADHLANSTTTVTP